MTASWSVSTMRSTPATAVPRSLSARTSSSTKLARLVDALLEVRAHARERQGIGALEAEDRLLGVADREDRARPLGHRLAGEELLGERLHDLPLLGIGVLRLVDQDVVEAAVELV